MNKLYPIFKKIFLLSFVLLCILSNIKSATTPTYCNTPLVGPGRIVNYVNQADGLLNNVINGNLNDSVYFTTGTVVALTKLISIKDINNSWAAGTRTGFTVRTTGASLNPTNMSGFQIQTFKQGVIQETISTTSSPSLNLSYIGTSNGRFRISFVTTKEFDEVALIQTSLLSGISSVSVYYAFVEPASQCDYDCIEPVLKSTYPSASVAASDQTGLCVLCSITNLENILDSNTDNFTSMNVALGVGVTRGIQLKIGSTIPAGSSAGFVIGPNTGLLNLSLLNSITLKTYASGVEQESANFSGGLINASILSGEIRSISFLTKKSFDEMRIIVDAGLLGATTNTNVYYGFIRRDADRDGFPDKVDKCVGNDAMDSDGDGIPDACDSSCNFNAGPNVYLHPQATSYDFSTRNLGSDVSWNILSSSQTGATISNTGLVKNMTQVGVYSVEVIKNGCRDTIDIHRGNPVNYLCHKAIVGPNARIFNSPGAYVCIGCSASGASNVINGDMTDYLTVGSLVSTGIVPIFGVKDISQTYPAGYKAGFVIEPLGGLLDLTVLSNLRIRTYLDNTLQDDVILSGNLAEVKLLSGSGNKKSLAITTSKPFNSIEIVSTAAINALTGMKIYYAFTEPATGCSTGNCEEYILASNGYQGSFEYARTGLNAGIVCALCNITDLANILDADQNSYATINQTVGLGAISSVSVKTTQTLGSGYQVGFIISGGANLLNASVLSGITITTYNNGVIANTFPASDASLAGIGIIDSNTGKARVTVKPTQPFNEIRLSFSSLVNALQNLRIYNVFVVKDTDGDGVPDCIDKCALGNDYVDTDGDGIPDSCDFNPTNSLTCSNNLLTMTISPTSGYTYSIYQGNNLFGTFTANAYSYTPNESGVFNFTMRASNSSNTYILQDLSVVVYPSNAKWTPKDGSATVWKDNLNWTDTTLVTSPHLYPIWCTDVVILGDAISYPTLVSGDECRDIYFRHGASIGKIQSLKYRHAHVEFRPKRNQWNMIVSPLRYAYSGDYHADYSWTNALSPKIFMRYFDVDYKTNTKANPDGVKGASIGNFSRAFANLTDPLTPATPFVIWVNGNPEYPDTNFPSPNAFQFPRRNSSGSDVQYSYHNAAGEWTGTPFYMPNRGTDIKAEPQWTPTSTPVYTSRYRFNYESISTDGGSFSIPTNGGSTIMVGNPFMSHLNFNQFISDNSSFIQNYYRVWDGNQFYTFIGSGSPLWKDLEGLSTSRAENSISSNIPPMQGFFVETKVTGPFNLLFTPAASVADATNKLRSSEVKNDVLKLKLTMDEKESLAIVVCKDKASKHYKKDEDIFKLFSFNDNYPEIYTVADENAIEINLIGTSSYQQIIPIGIKTNLIGEGEISIDDLDTFAAYQDVELIDKLLNKEYDLRRLRSVSFNKTEKDNLEGRFYLRLTNNNTLAVKNNEVIENNTVINVQKGFISVKSDKPIIKLCLYDAVGKLCYSIDKMEKYEVTFNLNFPKGFYLLNVGYKEKSTTYKLNL